SDRVCVACRRQNQRILNNVRARTGKDVFAAQRAQQRTYLRIRVEVFIDRGQQLEGWQGLFDLDIGTRLQEGDRRLRTAVTKSIDSLFDDLVYEILCLTSRR